MIASTAEVLRHHLQALLSKNLDEVENDYASDALLFTPVGVIRGSENIRTFFADAIDTLGPAVDEIALIRQDIQGEYGYVLWSAGSAIKFAGDSFHIRDGKILMQTAAYSI